MSGRKKAERMTMAEKIEHYSIPEPTCGCWIWTGAVQGFGKHIRGHVNDGHQKVLASRASYQAFKGDIPAGLLVLHKCDVGLCVNPDHLYVGTAWDNSQDMIRRDRFVRGVRLSPEAITEIVACMGVLSVRETAELYAISAATVTYHWKRAGWSGSPPRPRTRTHCVHGHELTPDNLYLSPRGLRLCVECRRRDSRERSARQLLARRADRVARQHSEAA